MKVQLFVYMHEKQIPMQEWICMKCPHTSHVEGDQLLNSQHVWACWDNWLPQSNVHLPGPNELTFCLDINGFQIPVKISCTGHRWRKPKDRFVFCSGTICLVLFHVCCSFVLRHLSPVHKIQCKCPNSHNNHPRPPFITWIYRECKVHNGLI